MGNPKLTDKEYADRVKAKHGLEVTVMGLYIGPNSPIKHNCKKHGVFKAKPRAVLEGKRCCSKATYHRLLPESKFVERVLNKYGDWLALAGKYVDTKTKVSMKCKEHGIWRVVPDTVLNKKYLGGCACPKGATHGFKAKTQSEYKKEVKQKFKGNVEVRGTYINYKTKILHFCKKHEIEYTSFPATMCPICNMSVSVFKYKDVTIRGKLLRVQGHEDLAILHLLATEKLRLSDIKLKGIPVINYRHGGKHKYFPDLFIPKAKRIIEVKSFYTMLGTKDIYYSTAAKARATNAAGYTHELFLMKPDGSRAKLPKNWSDKTYREVKSYVSGRW